MLLAPTTNLISSGINFSSLLTQAEVKNSTGNVTGHQLDEKDTVFFPIAALTNYYKFSGLKQHRLSYNSGAWESKMGVAGPRSRCLEGCAL